MDLWRVELGEHCSLVEEGLELEGWIWEALEWAEWQPWEEWEGWGLEEMGLELEWEQWEESGEWAWER